MFAKLAKSLAFAIAAACGTALICAAGMLLWLRFRVIPHLPPGTGLVVAKDQWILALALISFLAVFLLTWRTNTTSGALGEK